jgi:hypothetical protein
MHNRTLEGRRPAIEQINNGNIENHCNAFVNGVGKNIQALGCEHVFVISDAVQHGEEQAELMTKPENVLFVDQNSQSINTNQQRHVLENARVLSLVKLNKKSPVYNISVENVPEYFANGILVHNCAWKYPQETWDMLQFGLRLGDDPRCAITTTPKPIPLIRDILKNPVTAVTKGSTYDNITNLAPAFVDIIISKYEGTRLGRQELNAEILDDNPDALWQRSNIDDHRVSSIPELVRVVVGVDPAATSKAGSDDTGIVVAGIDKRMHGYVLGDYTCHTTPQKWAQEVIAAYHKHSADRIVGETNNGGEMVEHTLRTVDPGIPFKAVHASRGKQTRAEPISAYYEQGRIHHVGSFPALEDQMCDWVPGVSDSPDRVDALVWALTELLPPEKPRQAVPKFSPGFGISGGLRI